MQRLSARRLPSSREHVILLPRHAACDAHCHRSVTSTKNPKVLNILFNSFRSKTLQTISLRGYVTLAAPVRQRIPAGSLKGTVDQSFGFTLSFRGVSKKLCGFHSKGVISMAQKADVAELSTLANGSTTEGIRVETTLVEGLLTEIIDIPPSSEDTNTGFQNVLVVPGNPGLAGYYTDFAAALHAELSGRVRVVVVGHVGHTEAKPLKPHMFSKYSLQDQINHKASFLKNPSSRRDSERSISSKPPTGSTDDVPRQQDTWVVMGHSIGAHIGLQLMKRLPEQIVHSIGLFPFLEFNHQSREQAFLKVVASLTPVLLFLSAVGSLISKLPRGIKDGLARAAIGRSWSNEAIRVTTDGLLQFRCLLNYGFMGHTEFQQFSAAPQLDWQWLSLRAAAVSLLFGRNDHWGPLQLLAEIRHRVPAVEALEDPAGHCHAFCCSAAASRAVAAEAAAMLRRRFPS